MSYLWKGDVADYMSKEILFTVCSDIHITDKVPSCRLETKEEWLDKQFSFLSLFSKEVNPVIAGDIFEKSHMNSEYIMYKTSEAVGDNSIYCIYGNHDVPLRNLDLFKYSSYYILMMMSRSYGFSDFSNKVLDTCPSVYGIPWVSSNIEDSIKNIPDTASIVVTHKFVYDKKPYPTAPTSGSAESFLNLFPPNIKLVITGDNHNGFIYRSKGRVLLNCGTVFRDTIALKEYTPKYYRIFSDYSIEEVPINTTNDKFIKIDNIFKPVLDQVSNTNHADSMLFFKDILKNHIENFRYAEYITNVYREVTGKDLS